MKERYRFCIFFITVFIIILQLNVKDSYAQQKTFTYSLLFQGSGASGDDLPFWLYANKHGAVDINSPGGDAIINFQKNLEPGHSGFDYGFGASFVGRYSTNETAFFNQLYGVLSYGALKLKGGRFYEQLGDVNPNLSMGSLAISPNATPIPKIKFGIFHYTDVPLTHGYAEFKAEIAQGWFPDERFIHNPWLHQKSAYVRLGGRLPVNIYAGLVDEATWAGTSDQLGNLADTFGDFLRVFGSRPGNGAKNNAENIYRLGDHRGIWDFGFYVNLAGIDFHLYRQQIFNDADGLKFKTPDGMSGLQIDLPNKHQRIVDKMVFEYLYTKNQSGPIPPTNIRGGPGGRDNYYENYLYRSGWTAYQRTIGNPLFLNAHNPRLGVVTGAYTTDVPSTQNIIGIVNNRIQAEHFGLAGNLSATVRYKLLATHSQNFGTYFDRDLFRATGEKTDFFSNPQQWSLLANFIYQPFDNLKIHTSLASDIGQLYDDNLGVMLGIELLGFSSF